MKGIWNVFQKLKPTLLMVVVQFAFATINVLYKLAINDGMDMRVATVYRLAFASASTIPLTLIFDRKKTPKMTWKVLFLTFLCGLFGGSLFQNLFLGLRCDASNFYVSLVQSSSSHHLHDGHNLQAGNIKSGSSSRKGQGVWNYNRNWWGNVVDLFQRLEIPNWPSRINLLHPHQNQNGHMAPQHAVSGSKLLGVTFALASYCSFSLWLIIQAKMSEEFPSYYSSTALMSTMGAIQSIVFAFSVQRDMSQCKLAWNIRLLAVAYSVEGIVPSGIMVVAIAWCNHMRGPVFVAAFYPLQLVLVTVAASLMLNENLYLGSVLGSVLIVCGLYVMLWGKNIEMKKKAQLAPSEIIRHNTLSFQHTPFY